MIELSAWAKILVLLIGAGVVAFAVVLVVCFVSPFCPLHRILPESLRIEYVPPAKKKRKKDSVFSNTGDPIEMTKLNSVTHFDYGSPRDSGPVATVISPRSPSPATVHGHRRLYTADSSYSSMSPTTEAGSRPHSPTSTLGPYDKPFWQLVPLKPQDEDSQSLSSPPSIASTELPLPHLYGTLTVTMKFNSDCDSSIGRLVITIVEAHDLPGREYLTSTCDPFIKIVLLKQRTRLRRTKTHYVTLSEFQSQTMRRTRNPVFNQVFVVELPKTDLKDGAVKFIAFDRDKYSNPTELGEALFSMSDIPLKDSNQMHTLTIELQESKQNNGELLLGLSYLPTAERLSLHVVKAVNLKYENVATNIDSLNLEARILLIHNGKVIRKKKTPPVARTNNPSFDQVLTFDVPSQQLRHVTFLVGIAHRPESVSESDDSLLALERAAAHDCFLGKVVLGAASQSPAASHWQAMLNCPRQEVTSWHVLC